MLRHINTFYLYIVLWGIYMMQVCVIHYLYQWIRLASRKTKMYVSVGIVFIIVLSGRFVMDFYEQSSYFQQRVEDTLAGNSSGRDKIASSLWSLNYSKDT